MSSSYFVVRTLSPRTPSATLFLTHEVMKQCISFIAEHIEYSVIRYIPACRGSKEIYDVKEVIRVGYICLVEWYNYKVFCIQNLTFIGRVVTFRYRLGAGIQMTTLSP